MADVLTLPTAAGQPVHQHRRHGPLPRFVADVRRKRKEKAWDAENAAYERGRAGLPAKRSLEALLLMARTLENVVAEMIEERDAE